MTSSARRRAYSPPPGRRVVERGREFAEEAVRVWETNSSDDRDNAATVAADAAVAVGWRSGFAAGRSHGPARVTRLGRAVLLLVIATLLLAAFSLGRAVACGWPAVAGG